MNSEEQFKQLVEYIKTQLQTGAKPEDIKKGMADGGWAISDINKAFAVSEHPVEVLQKPLASTVREVSFPQEKEVERVEKVAQAEREAQSEQSFHKFNFSLRFIMSHPYFKPFAITLVAVLVLGVGGYFGFRFITSRLNIGKETTSGSPPPAPQVVVKTDENAELFRQLFGLQLATTTYEDRTVVYPFVGAENTVTVKGTLGAAFLGNAVRYAIYDIPSGLFIPIVNSSDVSVDAALKPLLETAVTVSGTHAPGSREITVTSVNGSPL
ncbi:MAG: hypothetical protein Q7S28_04200 [bacterium]|nr:hypothetical protein [bacterium]